MKAGQVGTTMACLAFLAGACAALAPRPLVGGVPLVIAGLCFVLGTVAVFFHRRWFLAFSALGIVAAAAFRLEGVENVPWLRTFVFALSMLGFVESADLTIRARRWAAASAKATAIPFAALGSAMAGWILVGVAIPAGVLILYYQIVLNLLPEVVGASIERSAGWLLAAGFGVCVLVVWLVRSPWMVHEARATAPEVSEPVAQP